MKRIESINEVTIVKFGRLEQTTQHRLLHWLSFVGKIRVQQHTYLCAVYKDVLPTSPCSR
jgi:hypothetical protein